MMSAVVKLVGELTSLKAIGASTQQIAEAYEIPPLAVDLLVGTMVGRTVTTPITPEQRDRLLRLAMVYRNDNTFGGEWEASQFEHLAECSNFDGSYEIS